jgi:hypothetical protein
LKNVKYKYLEKIKAIIHDNNSIQYNTIQFYSFTCRPNSPEANHKASANKKTQPNKKKQGQKTVNNNNNNNNIGMTG